MTIAMYAAGYMVRKMDVKEKFSPPCCRWRCRSASSACCCWPSPTWGLHGHRRDRDGILFLAASIGRMFFLITAVLLSAFVLMITMSEWRRERIFAYPNPWTRSMRWQGLPAVARAHRHRPRRGLRGRARRQRREAALRLPEAHTDFLLAVIGEGLDFVSVAVVIVAFSRGSPGACSTSAARRLP